MVTQHQVGDLRQYLCAEALEVQNVPNKKDAKKALADLSNRVDVLREGA